MAGIVIQGMGANGEAKTGGETHIRAFEQTTNSEIGTRNAWQKFDVKDEWWSSVHPDEGVVIYGPPLTTEGSWNPRTFFDLTNNKVLAYSRAAGSTLELDPVAAEKLFGELTDVKAINAQAHGNSFVKKWANVERTEIANPFKQRFDYSSMQRFLGHAMKYYAAERTLNYLKEAEQARAEAIRQYESDYATYVNSGTAERNTQWLAHHDAQFASTGTTVIANPCAECLYPGITNPQHPMYQACCHNTSETANGLYGHILQSGGPWETSNDPSSLTTLQNLISKTIWQRENAVINQLGEWNPDSNARILSWNEGLDGYANTLNRDFSGYRGIDNWESLSPANSFGTQPTLETRT